MRLPKSSDVYDASNEQQTRRALESAIDDIDGKLSSLLTSSGTLAANIQNLTVANGVNNDVALGYGTYTRISGPSASFTLTGLTGGEAGRVLLLRNTTTYDMTLSNDSGLSTAKNRILTQTGGNITLTGTGGCSALLFYDGTSERWILVTGDPLDTRVTDLEGRVTVLEADVTALEAATGAASETASGIIELATSAEALAGSDTTRAVTSAGLASSKSLSAGGYMKLPGGLIVQWGVTAGGSGTESFAIAFPTACFSVVATPITTVARMVVVSSLTTSGFSFGTFQDTGSTSAVTSHYIAVGH